MRFLPLLALLPLACTEPAKPAPVEAAPSSSPSSGPASQPAAPPAGMVVLGDGQPGLQDDPPRFNKPIRLARFDGGILVADISNNALRLVKDGAVTTLAKDLAGPHGVAPLPDGSIVVAEASGHALQKLTKTKDGWTKTLLAGSPGNPGFVDGPAEASRLYSPHGLVALPGGGLLIADIGNARLRLLKDGALSTVAGGEAKGADDGKPGSLNGPMDLALEASGAVLVADASANLVRRWDPAKGLTTLPLLGLQIPHGIAVDAAGAVIVAELGADRVTVHAEGGPRVLLEGLKRPAAVLLDGGELWVADLGHHQLKRLPYP